MNKAQIVIKITVHMSLATRAIYFASAIWKKSGLQKTTVTRLINYVTRYPLPVGLSYEYGTLYGWNIHENLHERELETKNFFKLHLKEGDRIADIGANIGYYTLQFSALVGESGKVVAFEPSPRAFALLNKGARGKQNVLLVQKGIYSQNTTLTLYGRRKGDDMASVVYKAGNISNQVSLMPLRDHPEDFTWAKIDVEGAEIDVLRGMSKPIQAVVEVAKGIQERHGGGTKKFLSDVEKLGYEIYFIVKGGDIVRYDGSNLEPLVSNIYIKPLTKIKQS